MSAHRYWRIYIDSTQGGSSAGLSEVQLRQSEGGADETGSGAASASSRYDVNHDSSYAVDDNISTKWATTNTAPPHWWAYDFSGETKDIVEIALTSRNDTYWNQAPSAFQVQISDDGSTWNPFYASTATWTTSGETQVFTFPDYSIARVSSLAGQVEYIGDKQARIAQFGISIMEASHPVCRIAQFGISILELGEEAGGESPLPVVFIVT